MRGIAADMKKTVFFAVICFFFVSEYAPAQITPEAGAALNGKIKTKYPVVLVHVIARNDRNRLMRPWGRIPDVLEKNGIEIYYGNTDAWGSILSNAELLKETIDSILEETNYEKVNIIAHSKGGIDSRYCIWRYDYGDKVASLTTISTPHYGAEIADLIFNTKIIHTNPIKRRLQLIGRLFGDVKPDMYNVNYELTTDNMSEFNATVTMDSRVYYQSIYSTIHDPSDDPQFSRSYAHIKNVSGDNDGLVSEKSASWGYNIIKIPDNISHEQIIDHGRKKIPEMIIPNIYLEIVIGLGRLGF